MRWSIKLRDTEIFLLELIKKRQQKFSVDIQTPTTTKTDVILDSIQQALRKVQYALKYNTTNTKNLNEIDVYEH